MSRGKHLSLEEARKIGDFVQFAKEHPSKAELSRFTRLLNAMSIGRKPEAAPKTSDPESCED